MEIEAREQDKKISCPSVDMEILGFDFFGNPLRANDTVILPLRRNDMGESILCLGKVLNLDLLTGKIKVKTQASSSDSVPRTPRNVIKVSIVEKDKKERSV